MTKTKKRIKRIFSFLSFALAFVVIFSASSCTSRKKNNEADVIKSLIGEQLDKHESRLSGYETPYTLCYQNADGTVSMYIFYSPIAHYDENGNLNLIDTSLGSVKDKGYKKSGYSLQTQSSDINSYFPKKLSKAPIAVADGQTTLSFNVDKAYQGKKYKETVYTDSIGIEHSSVTYHSDEKIRLEYIPTSTGVTANITLYEAFSNNELNFYVDKQQDTTFSEDGNQNVIFSNALGAPVAIIRNSFLSDKNGSVVSNNDIQIHDVGEKLNYSVKLNDANLVYPLSFSVSFEILPNSMPNVSVYENGNNDNLSAYSLIDSNSSLFMKCRVNYFVRTYKENIKNASYNFVSLGGAATLKLSRVKGFWNASTIETDNPEIYLLENSISVSSVGAYSIDISEYIKDCVHDDTYNTEIYGLNVSSESDEPNIISNYNSSLYKPYVRIDFYDMPWTFEKVDEIYPSS